MNATLRQFDELELDWCLRINRWSRSRAVRFFFSKVSRLGDGIFWYGLIVGLYATGRIPDLLTITTIFASGLMGVLVYKILKQRLVRERPFVTNGEIVCGTAPLDRYSFPSGHTLHAVNFTVLLAHVAPETLIITAPFMLLVALSRVVLGLHYPTDVLAGAAIGAALAHLTIAM